MFLQNCKTPKPPLHLSRLIIIWGCCAWWKKDLISCWNCVRVPVWVCLSCWTLLCKVSLSFVLPFKSFQSTVNPPGCFEWCEIMHQKLQRLTYLKEASSSNKCEKDKNDKLWSLLRGGGSEEKKGREKRKEGKTRKKKYVPELARMLEAQWTVQMRWAQSKAKME